ncbi:uncharacterized protein LOC133512470 isoform X2 [Syngnathoides biaculeatus]|uniref:uncharacterized protein LOC133512470 isoform X2 n=1 Tax=Syngnathoides biaculeatus TaxID=300417 RepID=UPI002ADD6AD3|nr:uncharacterized protein LOC133512470 isoform X2 [Syngnathoides biaculeatus]
MVLFLIWFRFVTQVLCEVPPTLPQDVMVDKWQLMWTADKKETTVTYSVKYRSFDSNPWKDVPTCKRMNITSCDITFTKAEADHGCVMLGVQAQRHELTSELVEACSRQGHPCSPDVSLKARPGFLTVHLSRNSEVALEGDHIKHRIYLGKNGELEAYGDAVSSTSIDNLKEGQRYCVKVQYTYFGNPVGLPSCPQCEVIPLSSPTTTKIEITVAIVLVFVILIPLIAYIPLFQRSRIKEFVEPSYKIPDPELEDLVAGMWRVQKDAPRLVLVRVASKSSSPEPDCDGGPVRL